MQKVLSYMWIDRVSERNSPTICVNYHFWKQNKLDQMSLINALNLILSKFCWCIVWGVETAKFLHFNIVGKLTSRALNPYQFCCHAGFQIWVITQETTWSTENLPCSRVLEKTESQIWHDSALYSDNDKPHCTWQFCWTKCIMRLTFNQKRVYLVKCKPYDTDVTSQQHFMLV